MAQFFFEGPVKKTAGVDIGTLLRRKDKKGQVGIEVEVEGTKLPKAQGQGNPFGEFKSELIPPGWTYHHDGSLRGQENAEYIFTEPVSFGQVPEMIGNLWKMFEQAKSTLDISNRTSIHVHLNMQKFFLNRLCSFSALYFSVEEVLTAWAGEHRIGNLFCLRAKDAPGLASKLKSFLRHDGTTPLSEGLHYSGLNSQALHKFGSMEVRTLRGCTDPQEIINWVSVLEHIYNLSDKFQDPRQIPPLFSQMGSDEYFKMVVGPLAGLIQNDIKWTHTQMSDALLDGIRIAQDLCYCRDWSEYVPKSIKPDPFGRGPTEVAHGISNVLTGTVPNNWSIPASLAEPSSDGPDWFDEAPEPDYDDEDNF